MKVVFPTCCLVDVHKSFLAATIIKTPEDNLQPGYQKKRFSTFHSDLNRFADWLHENDCLDVCMESTGKYWVLVFNILEKRGIRIIVVNPKWVRAVKENKDDTKDSKWIGSLFRIGFAKSRFIPAIEKLIEQVDICINTMVEKYDGAVSLLCTILGIDCGSAKLRSSLRLVWIWLGSVLLGVFATGPVSPWK